MSLQSKKILIHCTTSYKRMEQLNR